jgi:ApaG protein
MIPYVAITDDIAVTVRPVYLDGQSDVLARRFVFGYFVRIENRGSVDVQLLRRHWTISDSDGRVQEVEGEGVVGHMPVIAPGESHEYNSFCTIETFEGSMEGTYLMERERGTRFRVAIPRFDLRAAAN